MMAWRRFGWAWNELGADNPLGAILTKDGQVAAWTLDEFLATGRADAARFVADLSKLSPGTKRTRALDFGCGVGRITRALTDYFDQVVGVDVAASMIERARTINAEAGKCQFVLNQRRDLRAFPDASFSVVYCRLVLQHLRPEVSRRYIPELVRVLAKDGVLMFQLPERVRLPDPKIEQRAFEQAPVAAGSLKGRLPRPVITLWRRTKFRVIVFGRLFRRRQAKIDMFGINRSEVLPLVQAAGGRVLDVRPENSHGYVDVESFEYWITK
jgi:SAM-dependent methyltransferase